MNENSPLFLLQRLELIVVHRYFETLCTILDYIVKLLLSK